ncbi:MAG TPA: hypothetical protein VFW71_05965 [Actinomycetota bacterium]|nr:hypothetical protein [Actinomycetota bacterium]
MSGSELSIDCSKVQASAPSFVDELIKIALVERGAARLILTAAPSKMRGYAVRSAANRDVSARLTIID